MKKDFLFIDYSWVPNSRLIFNKFSEEFSADIVDELNILTFNYAEDYKFIFLYLHEYDTIPLTNQIIKRYPNAKLIQHDDTDFEDIQIWSEKKPDLVMHRELTHKSKNPWNCPVRAHHFPMPSKNKNIKEKDIDVFFMGCMTNPRRQGPVNKMIELANGKLKHLNWQLLVTPINQRTPDLFEEMINRSKIGLNCFGNSFDSHRIWELASCGVCTIMPESPLISIDKNNNFYNNYIRCKEDFSDLQEKIEIALENNKWKEIGALAQKDYYENHTPIECYKKYKNNVIEVLGKI
jgi:hypothetical protein